MLASPRACLATGSTGVADLATLGRAAEACRTDATLVAQKLMGHGVVLLALDFDLTLVTIHTRSLWLEAASKLALFFRPELCALMSAADALGIHLAVVTFSSQTALIRETLGCAIGPDMAKRVIIRGEDGSWEPKLSPRTPKQSVLAKSMHILSASEEVALRVQKAQQGSDRKLPHQQVLYPATATMTGLAQEKQGCVSAPVCSLLPERGAILLLDDDYDNIEAAAKNGNRVHHVKQGSGLSATAAAASGTATAVDRLVGGSAGTAATTVRDVDKGILLRGAADTMGSAGGVSGNGSPRAGSRILDELRVEMDSWVVS